MNKQFAPWFQSTCNRSLRLIAVAFTATGFFAAGCGGGSAGTGIVTPPESTPPPVYSDSHVTLPDAASRAFAPNYAPVVESKGIWQGRTLRVSYTPELETVVRAALHRWQEATGGFFQWEHVDSENDAQITFRKLPLSDFEPDTVGQTRYTFNATRNELLTSEVRYAETGSEADQIRVVIHEVGHAIGIHGHSDTIPDVMFPTVTSRNVITERDLNTMFWLYRDSGASSPGAPGRGTGPVESNTISCGKAK